MSFDLQALIPCDHRLYDQRISLGSDFRTLILPFPLGNNSISLSINHYPWVSTSKYQWGLETNPNIFEDEDVSASLSGNLVTVAFPPIKQKPGPSKGAAIKINGVTVYATDIDFSRGVLILPSFPQGTDVIEVTYEQDTTIIPPLKKIVFESPFKTDQNVFLVSYTAKKEFCLKCLGRGVISDWSLDVMGSPRVVTNEDKLVQDVRRFITTVLGSDPYRDWMGTRINGYIGKHFQDINLALGVLTREIQEGLEKLIALQRRQIQFQTVTQGEMLQNLVSVEANIDSIDPTIWRVDVLVRSQAGRLVEIISRFDEQLQMIAVGT